LAWQTTVAGHQPLLNNALEWLLNKGLPRLIPVVKNTPEGNLRLMLDVRKVQNVSGDVGYLNSLGLEQSAALDKSARIADPPAII
jgi:cell division inhibitor SulA